MTAPDEQRYEELARRWLEGKITQEEQYEFAAWYNEGQDKPALIPPTFAGSETEHRKEILRRIRLKTRSEKIRLWRNVGIAAAFLIAVAGGSLIFLSETHRNQLQETISSDPYDIAPGGDKATLLLENGLSLVLNQQENGVVYDQEGVRIRKTDSMILYESTRTIRKEAGYNTITTPRGGQFSLRLPDGSTVWLNAASSLRYPTQFIGPVREVELKGEAFFDIVTLQRAGKTAPGSIPFVVTIPGKQQVRVLGTRFNINSYDDEQLVRTTLIDGSVEVSGTQGASTRLKPNQQSALTQQGTLTVRERPDLEEAIAWKNGQIIFKDTDVKEIMRQISRWYDVDVVYQDEIPTRLFNGGFSRDSNLSNLLRILASTGFRFHLENRTIFVTL